MTYGHTTCNFQLFECSTTQQYTQKQLIKIFIFLHILSHFQSFVFFLSQICGRLKSTDFPRIGEWISCSQIRYFTQGGSNNKTAQNSGGQVMNYSDKRRHWDYCMYRQLITRVLQQVTLITIHSYPCLFIALTIHIWSCCLEFFTIHNTASSILWQWL